MNAALPRSAWRRWLPWLAWGCLLGGGLRQLAESWRIFPDYGYGWLVVPLALWMAALRWPHRPAPTANPGTGVALGALLAACVVFLATRLVLDAFPDWRPVAWLLTGALVAATLVGLTLAGGRAWRKHFAFPVCFLLTAVPWPSPIEGRLVHGLTQANATAAVELLTFFGQPARQHGAIIEVGRGIVGIDEACSGIRSLQGALMLALCVGEIFHLGRARRWWLVFAAVIAALATNFARTLWLVHAAAIDGATGIVGAHDSAGFLSLTACALALGLLGWCWRDRRLGSGPADHAPASVLPVAASVVVLLTAVLGEAGAAWWFRERPEMASARPKWQIAWPQNVPDFTTRAIRPGVLEVLRSDSAAAAGWSGRDRATAWTVHQFRWEPRALREALRASYHTPDVCLPASGCVLASEQAPLTATTAAGALQFRHWVFTENGAPLHVFFLVQDDTSSTPLAGTSWRDRLRMVANGRRQTGLTVFHVVLRGPADPVAARTAFAGEITPLLRR